jgi:hypothetical protein
MLSLLSCLALSPSCLALPQLLSSLLCAYLSLSLMLISVLCLGLSLMLSYPSHAWLSLMCLALPHA